VIAVNRGVPASKKHYARRNAAFRDMAAGAPALRREPDCAGITQFKERHLEDSEKRAKSERNYPC